MQKQEKPKSENPKNRRDKKKEEDELSEEDKELKEKIDLLCSQLVDPDQSVSHPALESLKKEVRGSTTSMTSVPKPFKFLKLHYPNIVAHYENLPDSEFKKSLADFLSVLSMTMAEPDKQISLKLLMEGTRQDYMNWGHEYMHHIAGDIGVEYGKRIENQQPFDDLLALVENIVPKFMQSSAEADAVDLLLEVNRLENIVDHINKDNFKRVFIYLTSSSLYSADPDEMLKTLNTTFKICLKQGEWCNALSLAIKLDDLELVKQVIDQCEDKVIKKQMAFQLARQRISLPEFDEEINKILSNSLLSQFFLQLAKDLEVVEPKKPDDIYKTHLENRKGGSQIDSARQNLASTFVNAFVNAGSGQDTLMLGKPDDQPWINKVKNEGLTAAAASLGLIFLWDPACASNHINDYFDLTDGFSKMGACIALGLSNAGIIDECDPAKAVLEEKINGKEDYSRLGSIIGLGMAYAGSAREEFLETLIPIIIDTNYSVECSAFAALSLGLIFVGKCNEDVGNAIYQTLIERPENQLNMTVSRFFGVALGLLFLGKQEKCEAILEATRTIAHPLGRYIEVCIEGSAYVGSGNVLKVQQMFHHCVVIEEKKIEEEESHNAHNQPNPPTPNPQPGNTQPGNPHSQQQQKPPQPQESSIYKDFQQVAVLAIGLIASTEEIGNEMALRGLNHVLQYCDVSIKRAVPLALALLNISNPKINVMDLLTKLSHDQDEELSYRAILGLGFIGAGTNNARLAGILRQLAGYYGGESNFANHLYLVRIAQGLLHMGKGLLTIQPFYQDKFLMNSVSMAGIIIVMHSCLDITNILLGKYAHLLYYLGLSMYPRMLFTLNEDLQNWPTSVRVGQAVDVVGQAGQPKKITGFQTHTSPVILAFGERAELGTEELIPVSDIVLENFVILKKNPNYNPEEEVKPKHKKSVN